MAKRGRKPKPTALKKLEGNPGKRALNEYEPQMPTAVNIKPPAYLMPDAKKEWKRLAPVLASAGVLTLADMASFSAYCQAYAHWIEAEKQLMASSPIIKRPSDGNPMRNPLISVSRAWLEEMKSFGAEFGLTPSTRTAMIANAVAPSKKEVNPMEQILTSFVDVDDSIESNFS
ncbi:MAG: phage terminase small subunit P27 family [Lachnospiraceae bacterium]|nr:phage terminase small subunit P27 family [Lachnospiraceae bacterium]